MNIHAITFNDVQINHRIMRIDLHCLLTTNGHFLLILSQINPKLCVLSIVCKVGCMNDKHQYKFNIGTIHTP